MREKLVYRDKASGRLITRYDAMKRDPSTWTREVIVVVDPRDESASSDATDDLLADLEEDLDGSEFDPS